ncbi:hypothetical protein ACG33_03890 [Steroidobacter denitrificans]|uniref:Thioesterase domain-containing protein n=2 Tax=Steroidobacter denitrificans TaxID=465721 RepID=A0A127F9J4_STEDE|nr:hypothetical protein ACG33_03890 [Steroidobacter denitrificans]
MPGTQIIAERAALLLARMPYARQIGACLDECSDDRGIVLRLPFQQRLIGNTHLPSIHGGAIGSFMQITALVTTFAKLGEQRPPRFINFSIDYLSQAKPQDLLARCSFQRVGRRVAAVSISCWQSDESAPVTLARAHLFVGPSDRG